MSSSCTNISGFRTALHGPSGPRSGRTRERHDGPHPAAGPTREPELTAVRLGDHPGEPHAHAEAGLLPCPRASHKATPDPRAARQPRALVFHHDAHAIGVPLHTYADRTTAAVFVRIGEQ